ncbi:MAG TPA: thermonuclease family protein [Gaiella sp.]
MRARTLVRAAAAATALVALTAAAPATPRGAAPARLDRVIDGDTIALAGGARVRLLQIDAPEPGSGECYARAAVRDLRRLLPAGAAIALERDPLLDDRDDYGRLLRYVWRGATNVNLRLVRDGSATVWLFRGERGRHAAQLLTAGRAARGARRGLWGACPRAVWNPSAPAATGPAVGASSDTTPRPAVGGRCDPSYPGVCIPPPPPDLDCADVPYQDFRVRPPDPHRFDGEGDGRGCES